MTTRDKTREKLLSSMRKTKKVIAEQPDTKQAHADTYAPPADRTAKVEKPAPSEPVRASTIVDPVSGSDPYQSRGRVWPD